MELHVDATEQAEQPLVRGSWPDEPDDAGEPDAGQPTGQMRRAQRDCANGSLLLEPSLGEGVFDELARCPRVEMRRRLIEHPHWAADEQRPRETGC